MPGRDASALLLAAILLAQAAAAQPPAAVGWPTYMHDNHRSGFTDETVAVPLSRAWVYQTRHKPQPAWPPPARQDFWHNKYDLPARVVYDRAMHVVSDGSRIFFGSSADDQVRCLDLATGKQLWTFFTDGPVRLAPALHQDRVFFGSDDGAAYCLAADDGSLIWTHRVAPADRRIPGNGRMISTWPVRGGVLVENGRARFAAGLFPTQGAFQIIVDATTGQRITEGRLGFSPEGYIRQQGNQLMIAAGRAPSQSLDRLEEAGQAIAPGLGKPPADYPFAFIGAGDLRFAGGDGAVAVVQAKDGQLLQQLPVRGKAYGLAVAAGALLVSTDEGRIYCFRTARDGNPETLPDEPQTPSFPVANPDELWPKEVLQLCSAAAERAVAAADCQRGYCLVYGSGTGCLAYQIAQRTQLQVIGVEPDETQVARARLLPRPVGPVRASCHPSRRVGPHPVCLVTVQSGCLGGGLAGRRHSRPGGGSESPGAPERRGCDVGTAAIHRDRLEPRYRPGHKLDGRHPALAAAGRRRFLGQLQASAAGGRRRLDARVRRTGQYGLQCRPVGGRSVSRAMVRRTRPPRHDRPAPSHGATVVL